METATATFTACPRCKGTEFIVTENYVYDAEIPYDTPEDGLYINISGGVGEFQKLICNQNGDGCGWEDKLENIKVELTW